MTTKFKQRGRNKKYPDEIEVWIYSELEIPGWISDIAWVERLDPENGTPILRKTKTSTGGVVLYRSGSGESLVTVGNIKTGRVCLGDGKIFYLSQTQLDLLYKEKTPKD